jgi:hypothetical protein
MPLNIQLFDRIRAAMRAANIHRQDNIFTDQDSLERVVGPDGEIITVSRQSALLEQTNLQINRLERYKDYDMMDEVGEVSLALDMYADESSLIDPERKHSIIVKAKNIRIKRAVEDLLYNTLMIDNRIRPIVRYLCKFGDAPFEIVPTKHRDGISTLRFINVYNFTRVQTKYGDLIGFYYQDPASMQPEFLQPWQVMHMRLTSYENAYHPYGRCFDVNGRVWTPHGSVSLKDIQKGDEVYSFDMKTQMPVVTKVLDRVISGTKVTLKIKTKHRTIQVTPEHPILAVVKNNFIDTKFGKKRDIKTKQYILAKDLVKGDKVVLPKLHNEGIEIPIEAHKCDNPNRPMNFPSMVNEDFAKLMGYCIGDGWVPKHNSNHLCIAEGEHDDINLKYIDMINKFGYPQFPNLRLPKEKRTVEIGTPYPPENRKSYGYFDFSSAELANTMSLMGLVGRCYEKRVPKWVFSAKNSIKEAFVEGLVDSDGSINVDKWGCKRYQLEVTSEELVKDIKVLLDQMNIECGNVSKRNRSSKITVIDGDEYIRHDSWIVYWYDSKMPSGDLMHKGKKCTKYDNCSDDYLLESIISIEEGDEIEVGDIQVSEHHNFVADGVVIHNSILDGGRKDFKRLRLMEDAALVYRLTRAPEKRVFSIPVGQIPTKDIPQHIMAIAREFKKHQFVDPATGMVNERYNPLIQDDDFFLPKRPDGQGPTVERLQGAENLDQIADIEYFKKKMVAGLKIPFGRVGIGQQTEPNGQSLAQVSPEFAKNIQWIQREVTIQLKKAVIVHLALSGYALDDIREFDLYMTAASAIDELYRIETWNTRADVIGNLKDTGLFPDEWILESFTDLSRDEIEQMQLRQAKVDGARLNVEESSNREQTLLLEYSEFKKRVTAEDDSIEESNVSYLINSNELDGLPMDDSGGVLVENIVDKKDYDDAKREALTLISAGYIEESDEASSDKMIAEEVKKVTKEN